MRAGEYQRIWRLVSQLPPGCALHAAKYGSDAPWGTLEHLIATLIEKVGGVSWQLAGGKGKKPPPFPRPDPAGAERRRVLPSLFKSAQDWHRERKRRARERNEARGQG